MHHRGARLSADYRKEFEEMGGIDKFLVILVVLAFAVLSASAGDNKQALPGLVLYFTFDEEDAKEIEDHSGNGNNAIIRGQPTWEEGKIGKALRFVADQDSLRVLFSEVFIPEDGMTMAVWVNFDGVDELPSEWGGCIIDDYKWAAEPQNVAGYFLGIEKARVRGCFIGGGERCFGFDHPPEEQWTHIAVTWDGTVIRGYIDGDPVKSNLTNQEAVPWIGKMATNDVEDLFIGAKEGTFQGLPGALDDLAIYDRGLSADEIKRVMGEGHILPVEPAGKLAAIWADLKAN